MGINAVRDEAADRSLSYGQGLGAGVLISLYRCLMSGAYNYIHFKFINSEFFAYQMEMIRGKWAAAGMSSTQMERAETVTHDFLGPVSTTIMTPLMAVFFGLLFSLIIAAFLKRSAAVAVPPPIPS